MREAVIVSTARTPITKAQRGEFNLIAGPPWRRTPCAPVERAGGPGPDRGRADRLRLSRGRHRPQHRPPGRDPRRLPVSVGGATINRYCASGLQAIAAAARIVMDGAPA